VGAVATLVASDRVASASKSAHHRLLKCRTSARRQHLTIFQINKLKHPHLYMSGVRLYFTDIYRNSMVSAE